MMKMYASSVGKPILAGVPSGDGFPAGALDALESASAGKIACPTSIFEEGRRAIIVATGDLPGGSPIPQKVIGLLQTPLSTAGVFQPIPH